MGYHGAIEDPGTFKWSTPCHKRTGSKFCLLSIAKEKAQTFV